MSDPGPLGPLVCFLLTFFKIHFFENSFRSTIRVSNSLDPEQARHFVGPGLGPNCLQMLSADNTSRQRVNSIKHAFLSSAGGFWVFFQNCIFSEKFYQKYHQIVKQFRSRTGPTFCPNCLQRLSADDRVNS